MLGGIVYSACMGERAAGPRDVASPRPGSVHRALVERLLEEGRITKEQHEAATALEKRSAVRIEDALIECGAMSESELLKYLASLHQTRFVSTERLGKANIERATLGKVSKKLVERLNIVPVLFDAQTSVLSVVTADPHNVDALDQIRKGAGVRQVTPLVARPAAIQAAIAKFYRGEPFAFASLERGSQAVGTIDMGSNSFATTVQSAGAGAPAARPPPAFSLGEPPKKPAFTAPKRISMPAVAPSQAPCAESYIETLNVLVALLENSRGELRGHSAHVARLIRKLGERIGLAPGEQDALVIAGCLHDLGKMTGYHLTALNVSQHEPVRLAAQKAHATPLRLMSRAKLPPSTIASIQGMYERYDGSGFPDQAQGREISLGARLLAIADTYMDLTENAANAFRKKLAPSAACDVLAEHQGTVFDPHFVDLLRAIVAGDDLRARILSDSRVALLVDPDPEETIVLELRLIQDGFDVRTARTISEARDALQKGGIHLVVSELDFGSAHSDKRAAEGKATSGDGFALLAEARRAVWGREMPWLILTRRQGQNDAQRSFELGASDYVIKPAATEVLVPKLRKALEKRVSAAPSQGVSGSLTELSLPDLVQVLWHGRKTGAVRLRRGDEIGEVHFVDGMVANAVWGKLGGEEAFYAMLRISEGEFAFNPNFRASEILITASPEGLLLEGMRRLDEE